MAPGLNPGRTLLLAGAAYATSSARQGCSASSATKVSTTRGSNCRPASRRSSPTAVSGASAFRYLTALRQSPPGIKGFG